MGPISHIGPIRPIQKNPKVVPPEKPVTLPL